MSLVVLCKNCGRKICGRDDVAGRPFRCPGCNELGQFPNRSSATPDAKPLDICPVCGFDLWVDPDQIQDIHGQRFHRACFEEVRPKKKPRAIPGGEVQIFQAGDAPDSSEPEDPKSASTAKQQAPQAAPQPKPSRPETPLEAGRPARPAASSRRPAQPRPAQANRPEEPAAVRMGSTSNRAGAEREGSLSVRCLFCSHQFDVPLRLAGQSAECPECGDAVQVPGAARSEPRKTTGRAASRPISRPIPDGISETNPKIAAESIPESPEPGVGEPSPESLPVAYAETFDEDLPVAMAEAMPIAAYVAPPIIQPQTASKQPTWVYALIGFGAAVPVLLLVFVLIHMLTRSDSPDVATSQQTTAATRSNDESSDPGNEGGTSARPRMRPPRSDAGLSARRGGSGSGGPARPGIAAVLGVMFVGVLVGSLIGAVLLRMSCAVLSQQAGFGQCLAIMFGAQLINGTIGFLVGLANNMALNLLTLPVGFVILTVLISNALSVSFGRALALALLSFLFGIVLGFAVGVVLFVVIAAIGAAAHSAAGAVV